MSLTKASFSMINGAVANVLDYGAVGDGVTDDTAAFNLAIATGKKVFVPKTAIGYVVNNIDVVTNMVIEGEKSGISDGTRLIVSTDNAGAFTVTTQAFQIEIINFIITAATGVTGARAYKQLDKSYYTAYARFTGIETSSKLAVSYDLLPIFTVWRDCRDGYIDAALAQGHQAINVTPANFSQGNQSNINKIVDSSFWGANGSDCAGTNGYAAMVDIAYGDTWTIDNTDFEAANIPAFKARGIINIHFRNARFEGIAASSVVIADITPSNPIGTSMYFTNCTGFMGSTLTSGVFGYTGTASAIELQDCIFAQIPSGVTLTNSITSIKNAFNINTIGAGAGGFLTGVNAINYGGGVALIKNFAGTVADNAVSAANGVTQSSGGFTSSFNTVVSSATAIGTFNTIGALAWISGYNIVGGNQGIWLVAAFSGYQSGVDTNPAPNVIYSNDLTGTSPVFTVASGQLKMATTTGSLGVIVSLLV